MISFYNGIRNSGRGGGDSGGPAVIQHKDALLIRLLQVGVVLQLITYLLIEQHDANKI